MRFEGRNLTVIGAYMYNYGEYPSLRHTAWATGLQFDRPYLAARMYEHNGIHCLMGLEYVLSPWVGASGVKLTSERKVWQGEPGTHWVNRHGRDLAAEGCSGMNFLHPRMADVFLDLVGEIYDRYQNLPGVEGLMNVTGWIWAPTFISDEVGYDDLTVGLFEKESGIRLGIDPPDPARFQKRYDRLMGQHRAAWLDWRALKLRAFNEHVAQRINRGKGKWMLFQYPITVACIDETSPFRKADASRSERDGFMAERFRSQSVPLDLYPGRSSIRLVPPLFEPVHTDDDHFRQGWNSNPGSREIVKKLDALFFQVSLNETPCNARAARRWLWDHVVSDAFLARGIEDNCMQPFVSIMTDFTPTVIFDAWMDCNMTSAHSAQTRRFCKAFYVTPEADFAPLPAAMAKGVIAQTAPKRGGAWLRLVNPSPYELSGVITVEATSVRDMVYDRILSGRPTGQGRSAEYAVSLLPNDIRLFEVQGKGATLACCFALPAEAARSLIQRAGWLQQSESFLRRVPADCLAGLRQAWTNADAFGVYRVLNDFEVARCVTSEAAARWQNELLADLAKSGTARINCACQEPYVDPRGNRWLPDQTFTGGDAYGNEMAAFAERGNLPIEGTDLDRVYQTEAYGDHIWYRIPVPNGRYNVRLHFAETYENNKQPGMRRIAVKVEGRLWDKKVDPFAMAGGFARPFVLTEKDVPVADGRIDIELTETVGINGIEIEIGN